MVKHEFQKDREHYMRCAWLDIDGFVCDLAPSADIHDTERKINGIYTVTKELLCGCADTKPCAEHAPVDSKLTASEKQLSQAILRVIDDRRYGLWAHPTQHMARPTAAETAVANAGLEADVKRERLAFADAIIDMCRKFARKG